MKKLFAGLLATTLLLSFGTGVLAKPNPVIEDGRNGNSEKNGSFELIVSDGPYYVGENVDVSVENLVIDGPIDTLEIVGDGELTLPTTPGEYTITVTATTYFKNGTKDGQIHTQVTRTKTIDVIEKPSNQLQVATTISAQWNGHPNENNTVRVNYTITIDGTTINHFVNFNKDDREAGFVEVEKDGYRFIVNYLAP
ncbi:hypothetical protein ACJ2A9_15005 [Anaerobacillus sp. MEB173]|uniref:hypothetical protein n=1 Tax=Anaerobacillus sp. MEB173 TaxID=3383345 RepID=UPI003F90D14C